MDLFNNQAIGFDHPLEMLRACHGKVERFCTLLQQLVIHIKEQGVDVPARDAAQQIYRYFHQAAPLHHQDEEIDFFPLLLQYVPQCQTDISRLTQEHQHLHDTWQKLAPALKNIDEYQLDVDISAAFVAAYRRHMAIENALFDLGEKWIDADELTRIGQNMAARRMFRPSGSL